MKIEHVAIWVEDLEIISRFYLQYFNLTRNEKYENRKKNYTSYFLSFGDGKTRIELMHIPDLIESPTLAKKMKGLAHIAISVGAKEKVDELTRQVSDAGYTIVGEPRTTGDGCYESVILDPEGNLIEITV